MDWVTSAEVEVSFSMNNDIKAIETEYDGHRFRSRLEARWAVFFNAIGLTYEYEIEGFEMDGTRYLPDFYIPSLNRWFEIKGKPLSLDEIKKCEEFCRRLDNENIKYSVLIGSPNLCAIRVGDFFWNTGICLGVAVRKISRQFSHSSSQGAYRG